MGRQGGGGSSKTKTDDGTVKENGDGYGRGGEEGALREREGDLLAGCEYRDRQALSL